MSILEIIIYSLLGSCIIGLLIYWVVPKKKDNSKKDTEEED